MATIRVTIGPAVDALQRVAGIALGENVTANYPAWQKQDGGEWVGVDLEQATHCVWDDHRFTATEIALAAAVDADPRAFRSMSPVSTGTTSSPCTPPKSPPPSKQPTTGSSDA